MLRRPCTWVLITLFLFAIHGEIHALGKPNIVLITIDSTRADRVGFLDSHSRLTPNLDAVARNGVVFERAYSQAPLTVASHATLLTGSYPQTHRMSDLAVPLGTAIPYLPDLLHARGYHTAAFVGSIDLDPANGPVPGFERGFDTYSAGFHLPQRGEDRSVSVERRGDQVVARAVQWIGSHSQGPFFLWVHLYDPHAPYASYDRAVSSADTAAGKLLNAIRAAKLYDDAVVVIASDHGESLGAHGEDTHGTFLYDETIHVPLALKLPKNELAGHRVKGRVRLVDVAPTILESAGVPVPSQMQGQSLLRLARTNPDADQPVYARSDFPQQSFGWSTLESWRAGKYLYVRAPKPELYDLTADPTALHNLAATSQATLSTIAAQLNAFDGHLSSASSTPATTGLTSGEMQKLASLGYVGLQSTAGPVKAGSVGVDPKDTIALTNKVVTAMAALDGGAPEKAESLLKEVLTAQPNLYLAQYGMGAALAAESQYTHAIEHLHKAIELQPESPWAHYTMGLSLTKTRDFKTAAVHLEIASRRLPQCAAIHSALAGVYEALGRSAEARNERTRASQLGSKS